MNHSSSSKASRVKLNAAFAALVAGILISAPAKAQTDTVYFDPSGTTGPQAPGHTPSGGTGDFSTSNFYDPTTSTDSPFVSGTNGIGTTVPGEAAVFDGAAGNVSVLAPVSPVTIEVGVTSGTETFGTAGAESTITLPTGWASGAVPSNLQNPITVDAGSENVIFNSGLNLNIFNHYYGGSALNSATTGNIAFNGGITFTNNSNNAGDNIGQPGLILNSTANTTYTLNSAVKYVESPGSVHLTNSDNIPYFELNSSGSTLTLTKNASLSDVYVSAQAGTVLDQGASITSPAFGRNYMISVGGSGQYLTDAAGVNVVNNIVFTNGGGTIGGATTDTTTFSGVEIVGYSNSAAMDLTAAAGGRVNFTGDLHNASGDANKTIAKIGAGTISLNDTQGRGEDQNGAWEVKNGTMLINGSDSIHTNGNSQATSLTGSGVEIDNVANGSLVPGVQTRATLGGAGDTSVKVTADGANSSITPGDPTVNGGIGTLTLNGGLTASSGLTLNFVLNGEGTTPGVNSSELFVPDLTLNGAVTVNFTTLDTVQTETPYTLIEGGANDVWTMGKSLSFNITAPAGYALDTTYGTNGYYLDTTPGDPTFSVEFVSVPEPSVYGLLGIGLVGLVAINRFRRLGGLQS